MASIVREVNIRAHPDAVWEALRDVGALHTRLAPGFVRDTRVEGAVRQVHFANGLVARETILAVDPGQRRVAWAILEGRFRHFNGAAQVRTLDADHCRFTWTTDLLPDEAAPSVAAMMEQGLEAIRMALEGRAGAAKT